MIIEHILSFKSIDCLMNSSFHKLLSQISSYQGTRDSARGGEVITGCQIQIAAAHPRARG